jgi:hypothetical protein
MRASVGIRVGAATVAVALSGLALSCAAVASADSLVTVGPTTPFPQNKQNEPSVAIDPNNTNIIVAGANEEIDNAPCVGSNCAFTHGVGGSGFYYSIDGGMTWTQPTYTGFSARTGTGQSGPIGTVPNYSEAGLVSDGDPVVVFGPTPAPDGSFSWANGARLYYGNLTSNFATVRTDQTFMGFEGIAVSHTDNPTPTSNSDWSSPVLISAGHQSSTTFSDKDDIWADNAATSPFFGNVYACYTQFRGQERSKGTPAPIMISRSTDGGNTWSSPMQLTQAVNNLTNGGRQGCAIATDSNGTVYVFFEGSFMKHSVQMLTRSFNGGRTFEKPRPVASVVDVGGDADTDMDGVQGSRTDSFPSVSIANGAPTGIGATNEIALAWVDAAGGLNNEQLLYELSTDGGNTFSAAQNAAVSGDRPMMPSVALSPGGQNIYFTYDALLQPFQTSAVTPARNFQGVLLQGTVDASGAVSGLTTVSRGAIGDARASSANALTDGFLGDYNTVVANDSGAIAVYNDARNTVDCSAIDTFREALLTNPLATAPSPGTDCPLTFGNTDIFAAAAGSP